MKLVKTSLIAGACLMLVACGDSTIDGVKGGTFPYNKSITVADALENSKFCKGKQSEWKTFEGSKGQTVVEFSCKNPNFFIPDNPEIQLGLRLMGITEDFVKNPLLYAQKNNCLADEGLCRASFGDKKVDRFLSFDPNSMRMIVQFSISKSNPDEFSHEGVWVEYNSKTEELTFPLVADDDALKAIYNDELLIPNTAKMEQLLNMTLYDINHKAVEAYKQSQKQNSQNISNQ